MAQFKHIAANSATAVVLSPISCFLARVVVNTKGASSNTLTLYNGSTTAGPVIAVIDTTANVGDINFGVSCDNGACAVLNTGTAADVTILVN